MDPLSLSLLELIILLLGAVGVGITVHFYLVSRRNLLREFPLRPEVRDVRSGRSHQLEVKERELGLLRKRLDRAEQSYRLASAEAEELRTENERLESELEAAGRQQNHSPGADLFHQVELAGRTLMEQQQYIGELLRRVERLRGTESSAEQSEELAQKVNELTRKLSQKENELSQARQQQALSGEMGSMLDNAYHEFEVLQEKIGKLEEQLRNSTLASVEFESLSEEHNKLRRELESERAELQTAMMQNQQLQVQLTETENKLREANFHRQQLQKKVTSLEELTKDMQMVAETNKKLQAQLKRIGELESMLTVISEERDELIRRQFRAS
ncbi:MAG TPA: hypothetical protein VEB63_08715 [Chitinophagaceae bacterium]|nr:hypothetical protein [Chitinophagaceae bacterium]